jgi:tetratricopeptide (TPR) repeat protein
MVRSQRITLALFVLFAAGIAAIVLLTPSKDVRDCSLLGDDAIAACSRVIASGGYKDHDLGKLHWTRGLLYWDRKDYDRAIADHSEAIRLDPNYIAAYIGRGVAYRSKGDTDNAMTDFSAAIRLDPKEPVAYDNRCWTRAIVGRELQEALADCNEALRLDPNLSHPLATRGLVDLRLERFDNAIADYDAALKINSQMANALYGRGFAKLKKGDTAGGNDDIEAAKAIQADIAEEFARYGVRL